MKPTSKKNIDNFCLAYWQEPQPVAWHDKFVNPEPITLEIGFGNGDFLIRQAKKYPAQNFIGLEIDKALIQKVHKRIVRERLKNIILLYVDARVALERLFDERSLKRIYALFPFPWPKKRHYHHRLFQKKFLKLANSRLCPKGDLLIVTDYQPFFEWTVAQSKGTGFQVQTQEAESFFDTRFERKWKAEGQKNFFEIRLIKNQHQHVKPIRPVKIQPLYAKTFDPTTFSPRSTTGKQSIIFKKFIFDADTQVGTQHILTAEGALTQKFTMMIQKHKQGWELALDPHANIIKTSAVKKSMDEARRACA